MNENERFETLKSEILHRAHENGACKEQYGRAYKSENFAELMEVLRDNFSWACEHSVLDAGIIEKYKDDFAEGKIYVNTDIIEGFLLAWDNATVEASGNATVEASGNATVKAGDNATVKAWGYATVTASGNATVEAWDNATVKAWGNATVTAWGNATVTASDNATVKAWDNATVEALGYATVKASGYATVEALGNATVKASGYAYITSYSTIDCKLFDNAIYRIRKGNTIRYASADLKFEKS